MSIKRITMVNVVLFLVIAMNTLISANEVVVSTNNNSPSIDVGTVLPGQTTDLTIKLDKSSNCDSIKGSVDSAASDDGWVGGGEGQSFTVTFNAPEDASGVHTGIIKGNFIGCPGSGGSGDSDWDVSADANVECPITAVKFPTEDTDVQDMDSVDIWGGSRVPKDLGKRVFSGADNYNGSAQNTVKVKVKFESSQNIPEQIYLKSFDVDDPSDDNGKIDSEDGLDNRANVLSVKSEGEFENGETTLEVSTNEKKEIKEKFTVTLSPGGNFRVCASCTKKALDDAKAEHPDDEGRVF